MKQGHRTTVVQHALELPGHHLAHDALASVRWQDEDVGHDAGGNGRARHGQVEREVGGRTDKTIAVERTQASVEVENAPNRADVFFRPRRRVCVGLCRHKGVVLVLFDWADFDGHGSKEALVARVGSVDGTGVITKRTFINGRISQAIHAWAG